MKKYYRWSALILVGTLLSQSLVAYATPSFEETLSEFVKDEACAGPAEQVFSPMDPDAWATRQGLENTARKVHAEVLAGRIATLPYESYMDTVGNLIAHYSARPQCHEGLMDLFDAIQAKLPEPSPLTRDELYAEERAQFIAQWAGGIFFVTTMLKAFSGTPRNESIRWSHIPLRARAAAEKMEATVLKLESLAQFLKSSPELETAAVTGASVLERQATQTGYFQWMGPRVKIDIFPALSTLRALLMAAVKKPLDPTVRARAVAFVSRVVSGAAAPFKQMAKPAPGTSRWAPLTKSGAFIKRSVLPTLVTELTEMGVAAAAATLVYGGYRGVGLGAIAPERPHPADLLLPFQALMIQDLENRVMELEAETSALSDSPMSQEAVQKLDSLITSHAAMTQEWNHFNHRAPRFKHTVERNADDAVTLNNSNERLGEVARQLGILLEAADQFAKMPKKRPL